MAPDRVRGHRGRAGAVPAGPDGGQRRTSTTPTARTAGSRSSRSTRSWSEPLEPILGETYHLVVYQEQVMAIAQQLAGYSLGGADLLRRAMGKKKKEILDEKWDEFSAGMKANGYSDEATKAIWDVLLPFSGYGFNKSHTAGYGLVSYWTAYLKANYPAEYMAALLTSVGDDKDKMAVYLAECRKMGIKVLPPDVNESAAATSPRSATDIRFGLGAIRNVGDERRRLASCATRRTRAATPPSTTSWTRSQLAVCNKRVVESLIKAGAFDSLGHPRKCADPGPRAGRRRRDRRQAQGGASASSTCSGMRRPAADSDAAPRSGWISSSTSRSGRASCCWPSSGRCSACTSPATRWTGPSGSCSATGTPPSPTCWPRGRHRGRRAGRRDHRLGRPADQQEAATRGPSSPSRTSTPPWRCLFFPKTYTLVRAGAGRGRRGQRARPDQRPGRHREHLRPGHDHARPGRGAQQRRPAGGHRAARRQGRRRSWSPS